MKLNGSIKVLLAFVLWALIIATVQFNLNYSIGLMNGTLEHHEIPPQVYLGIGSGLFGGLIFLGISVLIAKLASVLFKTKITTATAFISVTSVIFVFMLFTQAGTLLESWSITEEQVMEFRERLDEYKQQQSQ